MPKVCIVLAAVGIELRGTLLVSLECHEHALECQRFVIEDPRTEDLGKLAA